MKKLFAVCFCLFLGVGAFSQTLTTEEVEFLMTADYTVEQIEDMKVNEPAEYDKKMFYYGESWYVEYSTANPGGTVEDCNLHAMLITRLEDQRHATDEISVVISQHEDKVVLKPQAVLDAKYAEIDASYE